MFKIKILSPDRLGWIGFILSLGLLTIALVVGALHEDTALTLQSIADTYKNNPIQWIILTSPLFLTAVFYFLGQGMHAREIKLKQRAVHEEAQFHILENFIEQLEEGNLNAGLTDAFANPSLAGRLEQFRNKLITNKNDEERRSWEKEGLTRFSELIRSTQDIGKLSDQVISFLVKYTQCNQGAVFIKTGEEKKQRLERTACYAYDRKKFGEQTIELGEGLVGQCYFERETIVLQKVPEKYITITSGLGEATAGFLAIVPMKNDDTIEGILEIASFVKLEPYQIQFLEKACNAFASVIGVAMTAKNVTQLLEASLLQTEQLRAQEEEVRQNLEEMQALQEQLGRQLSDHVKLKRELEAREKVLGHTTILSETDIYGTITYVNSKFCEVSQFSLEELIGKPQNIVRHPDMPKEIFHELWKTIKSGGIFKGIVKNRKRDGSHYWVDATIVPIIEDGKIIRYIGARYHIEDETIAQHLFDEQNQRLGIRSNLLKDLLQD